MRVIACDQGDHTWMAARCGNVTASRIVDVLNVLKKGGEGADRKNYRVELIAERFTGFSEDHYISPEMIHGTEFEPFARAEYEIESGNIVQKVGFILHPTLDYTGASPDGLIGKDGCIEIKAPKTTTHIKWILDGVVPEEHQPQCLWVMNCAERQWCDFISYDPRFPDGLKLFVVRMERDKDRIAAIEAEVIKFNGEVESVMADLRKRVKEVKPSPEPFAMSDEEFFDTFGRSSYLDVP